MNHVETFHPQTTETRRYYRIERKFNGTRTTTDTVRSLIRAHS